jgi:hypothetical protein
MIIADGQGRSLASDERSRKKPRLRQALEGVHIFTRSFLTLVQFCLTRIASKHARALQMQRNLHLFAGSAERNYPEKQSRKTSFR